MKPIYIFEGADRVGKSTLANKFGQLANLEVFHFGAPDKALQAAKGHNYQYDSLLKDPYPKVLDRSWLSGLFYDIFRRSQMPNIAATYELEAKLEYLEFFPVYILVYRDWSFELEQEHFKEILSDEGYGTIEQRYLEHMSWPHFFWLAFNSLGGQFLVLNSDNLQFNLDLLLHHYGQRPITSINQTSKDILSIINAQSAYCSNSLIWPSIKWPNPYASRASFPFEGLSQAYNYTQRRSYQ